MHHPRPAIREAEASMLEIVRVEKGGRAAGGRYVLCRLLAQRARQIARRFSREERDLHQAVQAALDEMIHEALKYEGPRARAPLNAVKNNDCAELLASGRSRPDRQISFKAISGGVMAKVGSVRRPRMRGRSPASACCGSSTNRLWRSRLTAWIRCGREMCAHHAHRTLQWII